MKSALLILLIVVSPLLSQAHAFYFGFAEVEYNTMTEKLEMTLTVTTHDLERAFEEKGMKIENVVSLSEEDIKNIEEYVQNHLNLINGSNQSDFSLVGNEVFLDGTSNFYFESAPFTLTESLEIRFDVLMDIFPDQQNKLTFYYKDKTYTAAFTPIKKTKTIYFENEKQ